MKCLVGCLAVGTASHCCCHILVLLFMFQEGVLLERQSLHRHARSLEAEIQRLEEDVERANFAHDEMRLRVVAVEGAVAVAALQPLRRANGCHAAGVATRQGMRCGKGGGVARAAVWQRLRRGRGCGAVRVAAWQGLRRGSMSRGKVGRDTLTRG